MKKSVVLLLVLLTACSQGELSLPTPTLPTTATSISQSATTTTAPATSTTSSAPAPTTSVASGDLNILFIGNSHTSTHNIPEQVEALLETGTTRVEVDYISAGFLRTASKDPAVIDAIASGRWDLVILQGQEISQSHSIAYSQVEAIALAEQANDAGSRPLFLAEWSRQDIDETEYIEGIYEEMAKEADAGVIPVGRSWERFLQGQPAYKLWAVDGNHSAPDGAFLAAATIAYFIAGTDIELHTGPGREFFLEAARLTIENYLQE